MKNNEIELRRLVCTCCGEKTDEDNSYTFDGNLLCDTCYFEETVACEHCGNRIWNDDNSGSDSMPLCGRCYDDYYTTCEDSGRIIHRDYANYVDDYDDIPYCDSCIDDHRSHSIHDYSYKPNTIFYGDSNRYFGVELEIDDGGKDSDNADELLHIGTDEYTMKKVGMDCSVNNFVSKIEPHKQRKRQSHNIS